MHSPFQAALSDTVPAYLAYVRRVFEKYPECGYGSCLLFLLPVRGVQATRTKTSETEIRFVTYLATKLTLTQINKSVNQTNANERIK